MPINNELAEHLISQYHRENFDALDIKNVEWIGQTWRSDELVELYILESEGEKLRYYFNNDEQVVLDCEPDWS